MRSDLETIRWTAQEILPLKQSEWLSDAMDMLREDFRQIRETFPDEIHIIVDYPSTEVGYSWLGQYQETFEMIPERGDLSETSEMTQYHIFVNPTVDGLLSLEILVHELVHAAAGVEAGHGERFRKVAAAIGLRKSYCVGTEEVLLRRLRDIQEILGAYPLVTDYLEVI